MRCSVHCPSGGGEVVAGALAVAGAVAALVLAVVAAAGLQLVVVMSVLCVAGVVAFVVALRRGGATWRPERVPNPRVRKALEAAAAAPVEAAAPPAIEAPPVRLPVYAVITDVGVRDR